MVSTGRIPFRFSLVARFALLWSLLLGGLVALCGWMIWRGGRESLIETWRENLRHDAAAVELKLQSAVTAVMRDAAYLARTPTLREFVRAAGTPEAAQWRQLVEQGFRALLEGKPSYFQVRLIGVADNGRELIRLDNMQNRIEIVSGDSLQQKGDRDYFRETMKMPPGAVYVSAINLNQEFGKVTEPHIPTLRAAMQVPGPDGAVFGILIINVDVSTLLEETAALPGKAVRLELAAANGDYLLHPDPGRTFGSDLGTPWRFQSSRPPGTGEAEADLEHLSTFAMAPGLEQQLQALLSVPAEEWLHLLQEARNRAVVATGIAAGGGVAVIILLSQWLARRLQKVTAAMAAYEAGMEAVALPVQGRDELGRLAETYRQMALRVRDHVTRLEAARQEAEEATRLKEEFLAVMSHEIRTPMNAVTGLIRVLERNQPARHQEPVIRSLRTAARNLMALLNDALDYTRLKAGGLEFEPQTFSLRQHMDDLVMTHRPVAMQKGLHLEMEWHPNVPEMVAGDPVRLMQILNNLVTNALKFTDAGHVMIRVDPAPDGYVTFAVEDTGVGIPETEQAAIFAPFKQVRRPDGRQFDGSGLGLSIARELVERQGGTLSFQSRAGEGTCFTVVLPLPAAEAAASGQPVPAAVPDFTGLRILYVEDVVSNQQVMASILDETGAALTFAGTGAEALAAMQQGGWQLVLLDLQLPDASGMDLAPAIRAIDASVPILAVTAQAGAAVREACLAAGMSGFVLKPIEPGLLFDAISTSRQAAPEVPDLTGLMSLFGDKPQKLCAVLHSLAEEFSAHSQTLGQLHRSGDRPGLRALRHRMHSALMQLKLTRLARDLDALATDEASDALCARCQAAMNAAGGVLSAAGASQEADSA